MLVIKVSQVTDSGAPRIRSKAPGGRLVSSHLNGCGSMDPMLCAAGALLSTSASSRLEHRLSRAFRLGLPLVHDRWAPNDLANPGLAGVVWVSRQLSVRNSATLRSVRQRLRLFLDAADQVVNGPVADCFAVSPVEEFAHVADDLFSFLVFRLRRG